MEKSYAVQSNTYSNQVNWSYSFDGGSKQIWSNNCHLELVSIHMEMKASIPFSFAIRLTSAWWNAERQYTCWVARSASVYWSVDQLLSVTGVTVDICESEWWRSLFWRKKWGWIAWWWARPHWVAPLWRMSRWLNPVDFWTNKIWTSTECVWMDGSKGAGHLPSVIWKDAVSWVFHISKDDGVLWKTLNVAWRLSASLIRLKLSKRKGVIRDWTGFVGVCSWTWANLF
jgi:hypothetical protein